MTNRIEQLFAQVLAARDLDPAGSRTAKLIHEGVPKMAKKVAEEAVEVSLDAVSGNREAMIRESADLIYNLVVLWAGMDIAPADVWAEMERRERLFGIAEKLPKNLANCTPRTADDDAPPLPRSAVREPQKA
jgi:phosphoribosyl-ATP pyrophosphohydrolase